MEEKERQTVPEETVMERVNRICAHPLWQESRERIAQLEQDRKFCRHDTAHFLDVARLAYIENLERGLGIEPELIYAAALLHDIGRHLQYEQGVPHQEGSAVLARRILPECGFREAEERQILEAVEGHRTADTGRLDNLAGLLYRADKRSRMCLLCQARPECNWDEEKMKRNLRIYR